VAEFELDNREMHREQFLTLCEAQEADSYRLCGFIRTWDHGTFSEMCTLGVLETQRGRGIAHQLVEAILEVSVHPVFIVTIMPAFFEKYGFSYCSEYPPAINDKLKYCVDDLPVEETYVVMRRF
jgi:N-acetylglutamate synthase-like GNAT family acetyltransferase